MKPRYPFSKLRVYFNAIATTLALLLTITFLISASDALTLAIYLSLTLAMALLSLETKLYTLKRMEKAELEVGYPETQETIKGTSLNWQLVVVVALLVIALIIPMVSALFVDPKWWFLGFSSFVVGFSLSEVLLYYFFTRD